MYRWTENVRRKKWRLKEICLDKCPWNINISIFREEAERKRNLKLPTKYCKITFGKYGLHLLNTMQECQKVKVIDKELEKWDIGAEKYWQTSQKEKNCSLWNNLRWQKVTSTIFFDLTNIITICLFCDTCYASHKSCVILLMYYNWMGANA